MLLPGFHAHVLVHHHAQIIIIITTIISKYIAENTLIDKEHVPNFGKHAHENFAHSIQKLMLIFYLKKCAHLSLLNRAHTNLM